MKRLPIKERLILYFVLLSVVSIAIISLFSIFEAKKGITDRTFSQLTLLRDLKRQQLETFYYTRGNDLAALASSSETREIALKTFSKVGEGPSEIIDMELFPVLELVTDTNFCKSLFLIDPAGNTYRYIAEKDNFQLTRNWAAFSNTIAKGFTSNKNFQIFEAREQDSIALICMASPVLSREGRFEGTVITELKPEAIYSIIYDKFPGSGLGKTGEAYLAGTDGFMRTPSRFIKDAVMNIPVRSEGFQRAINGDEHIGIYKDYRGIDVLGAYGMLEINGFSQVILAEIDVSEAMVPLQAIRNEILIVSMLIILVIFIITWFLAHGITKPIVSLKNAADFISKGNYKQELEIESDDEIGELTRAFNVMASDINAATRELKEREERLRHFYEATLDGIVLHDNGMMVLSNSAIQRLTGYTSEELASYSVHDILRISKENQCDKNTRPEIFESVLIKKDKSLLPVEVQESCVDYQGRNIRASVIRDISARKQMEAELADERNKRIRAVFDGKDSEQKRLSRELHDGLGQQLVACKMILESSLYAEDQFLKGKIAEVQHIFDQIIGDIRRISHDLSPSILHEFGLKAAMENLCKNLGKASGLKIDFHFDLRDQDPDDLISTYIFRISQESINNIQLHSGATEVSVILQADDLGILLEIEDNGCGFNLKEIAGSGGNGLYNIRERVNILRGQLNVKSRPGKGTKIQVRVPLNPPSILSRA
jgi:PAS domain S-box-containing protein